MGKKLLSVILLAAMLLQMLPVFTAQAASTYTDSDWEYLILKWQAFLCGDDQVDWSDPNVQNVVANVNSSTGLTTKGVGHFGGLYWLDFEENRSNPKRAFGDIDITTDVSSTHLGNQFLYLNYMAQAYGTRDSKYIYKDENGNKVTIELYQNPDLREAIFYGLEKCLNYYNREKHDAQKSSQNNTVNYAWWDWAYQSPLQLSEALIAVYPYQNAKEAALAETAIENAIEIVDLVRPVTTGTSEREVEIRRTRLNICTYLAALKKDTNLMKECQDNLIYFLESDPAFHDGVKEDYSYICHRYYAMEGRYGIDVLINRIIDCYAVLAGTAFELKTANRRNQFDWMMNTFKPVMTESGIMAMNNGRVPYCGISQRASVIKGALRLIGCFGEAEDLQLKQFIRSIVVQSTEKATQNAYASHASYLADVNLISLLKEIVLDTTIPDDNEEYAQMRYMTDRAVQHRDGYTVGLAMSSNRILPYESVNGNNCYGWYSGDGMLYVYPDTDSYNYDPYGDDFWRFANMHRLAGTTEEDATLRLPYYNRCEYIPGNTYTTKGWVQQTNEYGMDAASFVGGAELKERYIAAAMDFEAYSWTQEESEAEIKRIQNNEKGDPYASNNRTKQVLVSDLEAKKSYFMFDDEIVCVGSDINFTTRNNAVNTYVDNRQLLENSKANGIYGLEDIIVDGELLEKTNSFAQPLRYTDPTYVYQENFGGYYFPQGGEVYVNKTHRQTTADGDNTNDDYNEFYSGIKVVTEQHSFFELWLCHGVKPQNETYSYVMLPEMSVAQTESYCQNPDVAIVVASDDLHVVRENTLGITAMVFWKAGTYGDITVDQPMIVMVQEQNGTYSVSASDPTHNLSSATITINRRLNALSADGEIAISGTDKTILQLDLSQNNGKSLQAEFSTEEMPYLMFDFSAETSAKYENSAYGFLDYSDAQRWATSSGATVTIQNGTMILPMVTEPNSSNLCTVNIEPSDSPKNYASSANVSKANFLNYDPQNAEIFQIRLKIEGATHYGTSAPNVTLFYLPEGATKWSGAGNTAASPNPWRDKIAINIDQSYMADGANNGKYVTLSASLENSKFTSYDKINGLMIQFANMCGGTVTIDHIYIGPKTESLYFGFDGSDPARFNEGAYGGYDFDREENPQWGVASADAAGNSLKIDNENGTVTVYVTHDYNGSSAKLYGPYLETAVISGHYPSRNESEYPLSYCPSENQVMQIRFKTENVKAVDGLKPFVNVLYAGQKDGTIARYSDISAYYSPDAAYQVLTVDLGSNFAAMDVIHSLGLRFRNIQPIGENDLGSVVVDYIYVGAESTMPTPHNYVAVVTAPTCTESGFTTYSCSVCAKSYVADMVEALGHHYEAVITAPDCTNGGYTTYTCTTCGDYYIAEETDAGGHSYNAVVTAPTCTEAGYTTYTCACGDNYIADETAALGHSYTYTNNGENHTVGCANCDLSETSDHEYADGTCVCGAVEATEPEIEVLPALNVTPNISIGAEIQVMYTIMARSLAAYESFYLEVSKTVAGGDPVVTTYGMDDDMIKFEEVKSGSNVVAYRAIYTGIGAKNMGDEFTTTLYAITADGAIKCGYANTTSIKSYLMGKIEDTASSAVLKTLAVDMLNYGAAAQVNFDYDAENLVNADLTDAQKALGTQVKAEATDMQAISGTGAAIAASVSVQNKVFMYLTVRYAATDASKVKFIIKDSEGKIIAELTPTALAGGKVFQASYDGVGAKQMREPITIEMQEDGVTVSQSLTWSVESYVAQTRASSATGENLMNMVNALLIYGDSAAAYLAK